MNIPALKAELLSLLQNTTNLTATEKQKLRNRFVLEYQSEWNQRVASGTADTAANRAQFAIDKTVQFWADIYRAGSHRENQATLPPVETME